MATTRFTHTITIAVAALVASLALTALAVAGQGERKHIQDPYFVVTSGGSYVDYNLAATPAKQRLILAQITELCATHPELAGRDAFDLPYLTTVYRAIRI